MLECLIIGDSIAVGTKMFAPTECVSYAKGGYNTWQWNRKWGKTPLEAKTVVISLGTNDHQYIKTHKELYTIRVRIKAQNVVWIMPPCNAKFCKPNVNAEISSIAYHFGDKVIKTDRLQSDRIHPSWKGYKELVSKAGI
jgi:lysophospholipase L1-like esterase